MKMRNKGKVHPFSSSSASSPSAAGSSADSSRFDVLKLLPAAILTLISVLSFEDHEVLAYLLTRSLLPAEDKKKSSKKQCFNGHGHKSPPLFDCGCFECYTSFWCRWDSSPHRELIHQAIESLEEQMNNGEQFKKSPPSGKNRKKERLGRRKNEKTSTAADVLDFPATDSAGNQGSVDDVVAETEPPPTEDVDDVKPESEDADVEASPENDSAPAAVVRSHKGFARKVLPDFMGIFSSRLWSLWSPKV